MESINIYDMRKIQDSKVIKEIPILTDQLMATILFIDSNTTIPAHIHTDSDEMHYVIKGNGKITIGSKSKMIDEGMLVLAPKAKPHYFSTSKEQLMVLSISHIIEHDKDSKIKSRTEMISRRR